MRTITEFIVRVADLAEAEGRLLKHKAVQVIAATILWLAAGMLVVASLLIFAAALFVALLEPLGPVWALVVVGLVPLLAGTAAGLIGRSKVRGD